MKQEHDIVAQVRTAQECSLAAAKVIGREAALAAAAAHFGVAVSDLRERDVERERGFYEVDFEADDGEYECLVNVETGEVSRARSERDDDRYDD
ncbi:MAG: hypothetical protein E7330_06020 [Clostridiales bacterium]|nr:hypothetical protein [Clostridiales bacterium]